MSARSGLIVALATSVVALAGGWLLSASGGTRGYSFDHAPGTPLIHVTYGGGLVAYSPDIAVYGDGAVDYSLRSPAANAVAPRTLHSHISPQDLSTMLDDVIRSGLIDYDAARVKARMLSTRGRYFPPADAPAARITFWLSTYEAADGNWSGPLQKDLVVLVDPNLPRLYPDVPELAGIDRLLRRLGRLQTEAEKTE